MKVVSKFIAVIFILTGVSTYAKNTSFLESNTSKGSYSISAKNVYSVPSKVQETINVNKLMRKVQRQYSRQKSKKSHIAQAYFRETGNYNGKYVFFYESRGYSIFMKKPWNAALFSNYKFFPEQSRISDIDPDFQEKMKAINNNENRKESNFKDVGFSNNENNYRRFQEYGPLSRKKHLKFQYSLDSVYENNGIEYYNITFSKDGFQGFLVVNSRNLNLVKTEYKTDQLISSHNKKYVQGKVKLSFLYEDRVPYLSEMVSTSTYNGLTLTNYLKTLSDNFSGFDVTEKEYWGFNAAGFHANIHYNTENWPAISYYEGDDFKKINKDLSYPDKTLEEQFIKNAQQPLNPNPDSSVTLAEEKIQELKTRFGFNESAVLVKKKDDAELIKHLEAHKKEVEHKEKQLLTEDLIKINKAVKSGEIAEEEAEKEKKAKALKRAKNINDQQDIIQSSIDLIERNKDNDNDSLYYRGLEFIGIKMKNPSHEEKARKTFKSLVIGAGFSNTNSKGTSIGDRFRGAGSRYFEIGYKWSTGLTADNFLRLNYGFLFQFDGFKPKTHNQYFKVEDNQVVLEDFPNHLKKAKLRTSNFIIPLHFEIGPTDKNGYRNSIKIGAGGFAGLNLSTIQKLKYTTEDGHRHKKKNRFNSQAEDFVYGWSSYIGYKNTALILRYHLNSLFKYNDIDEQVVTLGIRWSL